MEEYKCFAIFTLDSLLSPLVYWKLGLIRTHGTITPSLIQAQSRYMTRLLSTITVFDT
jgi:hypothetical protein